MQTFQVRANTIWQRTTKAILRASLTSVRSLVLISSLGIAVGIVFCILQTVIFKVYDEHGAVKRALKGFIS